MTFVRRILCMVMLMALALSFVIPASAEENWSWENGVLTVTGQMRDYPSADQVPWKNIRKSVVKVVLPDATAIGTNAFYGCVNMESIDLPNVTEIHSNAFWGCKKLKGIELQNVTKVDAYAFRDCGLTHVTIPAGLTELGESIFFESTLESVGFEGAGFVISEKAFADVTATAYYPEGQWNTEHQGNFGGNLVWKPYTYTVDAYDKEVRVRTYYDLQTAADTYHAEYEYLKLNCDLKVDLTLNSDLHIDLAGNDLSGVIKGGNFKIYGMDSTTFTYQANDVGYLKAATNAVVSTHRNSRTGSVKRHLALKDGNGWSFHRVYAGIMQKNILPAVDGFSYEAAFYADEMVRQQVVDVGFNLWINRVNLRSYGVNAFRSELTLQLKNIPVEKHGIAPVSASVYLQLKDGTVMESNHYVASLKDMLVTACRYLNKYSSAEIQALQVMCQKHIATVSGWNIPAILNWKEN